VICYFALICLHAALAAADHHRTELIFDYPIKFGSVTEAWQYDPQVGGLDPKLEEDTSGGCAGHVFAWHFVPAAAIGPEQWPCDLSGCSAL
jgi:hypothetical protein